MEPDRSQSLPLSGLKILEAATIIGGPMIAAVLSDYGADVIKVEDPGAGDPQRNVGPKKEGVPIWWQISGRNKRCVTLNLRHAKGQEIFRKLASEADVVVNGFRPGRMEKWGLGYEDLRKINPRIIMVHISGFGQTGPYSHRPGYGTLAEAMCGFAYTNGHADRPPCLPQMGLADSVAALYAMNAVLTAVYERDVKKSGLGQSIDVSLIEPLLTFNAQVTYYDQLGIIAQRSGSRTPEGGPRGTFQTADDQWVAFAGSSPSTAWTRILRNGRPMTQWRGRSGWKRITVAAITVSRTPLSALMPCVVDRPFVGDTRMRNPTRPRLIEEFVNQSVNVTVPATAFAVFVFGGAHPSAVVIMFVL